MHSKFLSIDTALKETNYTPMTLPEELKIIQGIAYKKQRNYVVALNQKSKYKYFNNLDVSKEVKSFWKTCKPYFSNKHSRGILILIEKMSTCPPSYVIIC